MKDLTTEPFFSDPYPQDRRRRHDLAGRVRPETADGLEAELEEPVWVGQ
jgi:hypothetical protein